MTGQLGPTPATPAQPSPGVGLPAIPAVPAIPPQLSKPTSGNEFLYITTPGGGAGWVRGQKDAKMAITWYWYAKRGGTQDISFEINLLKSGKFFRNIANVNTKTDNYLSQFWWEIPADIPPSSDYTIEVREVGKSKKPGQLSDTNDKQFSILGETVTVRGRLVDRFSGQPLANQRLQARTEMYTDSNGGFTYSTKTAFPGYGTDWSGYVAYAPDCYMQGSVGPTYTQSPTYVGSVSFYNDYSGTEPFVIPTWNINTYDLFMGGWPVGDYKTIPILGDTVDAGDVAVRGAADTYVTSDKPFTDMMHDYVGNNFAEGGGTGNFGRTTTTTGIRNMFPVDVDTRIVLTDATKGSVVSYETTADYVYYSTYFKIGPENKCKQVVLNYTNGNSEWSIRETPWR
ncbi:TPA: hypothetical protein H1016_04930 [archaeon]|uniref:Uncharacterized protein n=1 Tax=Candidatus Naiadarchaeum limnaeum TaxID=2756139 RepID=A0A832V5Z1_9ARCH|nr:hypothetical protein [Candidatus Naiadarchaeum limnaeum]